MRYAALLRAINVGGSKIIKMEELKKAFEAFGLDEVKTYIQSGNVVFTSAEKENALTLHIEKSLKDYFGHEILVMVRSKPEMEEMIKKSPYGHLQAEDKTFMRYVSFLKEEPAEDKKKAFLELQTENESYHIEGLQVYSLCKRDEKGQTFTSLGILEKILKVPSTSRNWNSVNKIMALL